MKIYKSFIILFFVLTTVSCSAQVCRITDREIIETLFQDEKINNYLHFEINERKKIWVVKNEFISLNKNFEERNLLIYSESKDNIKSQNYIEFKKLKRSNDKVEFDFYYKIENVSISGMLFCKNKRWEIKEVNIIEF